MREEKKLQPVDGGGSIRRSAICKHVPCFGGDLQSCFPPAIQRSEKHQRRCGQANFNSVAITAKICCCTPA